MPGWEVRSFGWHGDDGKIFDASSFGVGVPVDGDDTWSIPTTFAAGDVVGLGVTRPFWDKSRVFFQYVIESKEHDTDCTF